MTNKIANTFHRQPFRVSRMQFNNRELFGVTSNCPLDHTIGSSCWARVALRVGCIPYVAAENIKAPLWISRGAT